MPKMRTISGVIGRSLPRSVPMLMDTERLLLLGANERTRRKAKGVIGATLFLSAIKERRESVLIWLTV